MEQTPQSAAPASNAAQSPDRIELQKKLAEVEGKFAAAASQAEEYLNGWKRAKADYQNLKREHEQQSWQLAQHAVESVVVNLWLEFYSNLLPAFAHIPPEHAVLPWVKGLQNGIKQFEVMVKKLGFESFTPAVGDPFDPVPHEAVASVLSAEHAPGTVVAVVRPGLRQMDSQTIVVTATVQVAK